MNGSQGNGYPPGDPRGGHGDPFETPDEQSYGPADQGGSGDWFTPRRGPGQPSNGSGGYPAQDGGGYGASPGGNPGYGPAQGGSGGYGTDGRGPSAPGYGPADYRAGGGGYPGPGSGGSGTGPEQTEVPGGYRLSGMPAEEPVAYRSGPPNQGLGGIEELNEYGERPPAPPRRGGDSGGWDNGRRRRKKRGAGFWAPAAAAVVLALLAGAGIYAFAGSGGGCGGSDAITLNVAVAPELAPALNDTVKDFNGQKQSVGGKCVKAVVSSADPSAVTTLLSGQGVSQGETQRPDVWIPDSTLWADMVQTSDKGKNAVRTTTTSVAQTPLVVAMPKSLASRLSGSGMLSQPSWDNLLSVVGAIPGGAVTKNQTIPAGTIKFVVPDPTRNATGMAALMLTNTLLASDPNKSSIFTGIVRTVQHNTVDTVTALFKNFGPNAKGQFPVALAPEQALWKHNQSGTKQPAIAVYPIEGTATLDYPYTVTTTDSAKAQAAALLEKAVQTSSAQNRVKQLGFRASDGTAPSGFGASSGTTTKLPRKLPSPTAAQVEEVMQAWSKLGLAIRMLAIFDVSGSMAEKIPGTKLTRMQGTAQAAQAGLGLLSDDNDLGLWEFSTNMDGAKPYKPLIPVGPLNQRAGSVTRRQLVQNGLDKLQPKKNGDTALYRTILAAYRYMKNTYQPDKINSILLLTDGVNDDKGGMTDIRQAVAQLNKEFDPKKPVKVLMLGFGKGADRTELTKLADATQGDAYVAYTLPDVQKFLLQAISKRLCTSGCTSG